MAGRNIQDNQASLISSKEVLRRVQRSKSWLYKQLAQKAFPQPIKIGERAISFVESEIDEWIGQRIAERGEWKS